MLTSANDFLPVVVISMDDEEPVAASGIASDNLPSSADDEAECPRLLSLLLLLGIFHIALLTKKVDWRVFVAVAVVVVDGVGKAKPLDWETLPLPLAPAEVLNFLFLLELEVLEPFEDLPWSPLLLLLLPAEESARTSLDRDPRFRSVTNLLRVLVLESTFLNAREGLLSSDLILRVFLRLAILLVD